MKYDNTNSRGSIALEEINKNECKLDNLSDHHYEEIPSARVSFEDIYIDDTIEDQKKYMDNISDTDQIPERIYYTLKDFNKQEEKYSMPMQRSMLVLYHISLDNYKLSLTTGKFHGIHVFTKETFYETSFDCH